MARPRIHLPAALFDPFASSLWISYEATCSPNLFDNPGFIHELAHYSQSISTGLGLLQTLFFHELYTSTCKILVNEGSVSLPLADMLQAHQASPVWAEASLAILFQEIVIAGVDSDQLTELVRTDALKEIVSASMQAGGTSPFYFDHKASPPHFGVQLNGESLHQWQLSGHFIQELYARTTEFMSRWANEKLSLDDATTYFLQTVSTPYELWYLVVQKMIIDKLGYSVFAVQQAVAICHLCSYVALNGPSLGVVENLTRCRLRAGPIEFGYYNPGEIFMAMMAAVFAALPRPDWDIAEYCQIMTSALSLLNWPTVGQITDANLNTVNLLEQGVSHGGGGYHDFLKQKCSDSKMALDWLFSRFEQGDVMDFIRGPAVIAGGRDLLGPLIVSPETYSLLRQTDAWNDNAAALSIAIRGMIIALVTRKLWYEDNVTCLPPAGHPRSGSLVECQTRSCTSPCGAFATSFCANQDWMRFLAHIPGLVERLSS